MDTHEAQEHVFRRKTLETFIRVIKYSPSTVTEEARDWVTGSMIYRMAAHLWAQTASSVEVVHTFPKPTFLEWLLGKPRNVKIHVEAENLLLSPVNVPEGLDTIRLYTAKAYGDKP